MQTQQLLVPSYLQAYNHIAEAFTTQPRKTYTGYTYTNDVTTETGNTMLENFIMSRVKNDGPWLSFGTPNGEMPNIVSARKQTGFNTALYSFEGQTGNYNIKDLNKPMVKPVRTGGLLLGLKPKRPSQMQINSLGEFLFWRKEPCAFVHINCESFSSTITVLNSLYSNNRIVSGTIILFDNKHHLQLLKTMNTGCLQHLWQQPQVEIPASVVQTTVWNGIAIRQW